MSKENSLLNLSLYANQMETQSQDPKLQPVWDSFEPEAYGNGEIHVKLFNCDADYQVISISGFVSLKNGDRRQITIDLKKRMYSYSGFTSSPHYPLDEESFDTIDSKLCNIVVDAPQWNTIDLRSVQWKDNQIRSFTGRVRTGLGGVNSQGIGYFEVNWERNVFRRAYYDGLGKWFPLSENEHCDIQNLLPTDSNIDPIISKIVPRSAQNQRQNKRQDLSIVDFAQECSLLHIEKTKVQEEIFAGKIRSYDLWKMTARLGHKYVRFHVSGFSGRVYVADIQIATNEDPCKDESTITLQDNNSTTMGKENKSVEGEIGNGFWGLLRKTVSRSGQDPSVYQECLETYQRTALKFDRRPFDVSMCGN